MVTPVFTSSDKDDWNCQDGEVESCVATSERGWLDPDSVRGLGVGATEGLTVEVSPENPRPVVGPPVSTELPEPAGPEMPMPLASLSSLGGLLASSSSSRPDARLLCRHFAGGEKEVFNLLLLRSDGRLAWAPSDSPGALRNIAPGKTVEVEKGVTAGDYVALLTPDGIEWLHWDRTARTYQHFGSLLPQLSVEFALVREAVNPYSLVATEWPQEQFTVPMTIGDDGYPQALIDETARIVGEYDRRCREARLFTAPFFVMCAWRLADGTRIPAGPPVLMVPNSEAPTVALNGNGVSESATSLTVTIMGRACSLHMRVLSLGDAAGRECAVSHLEILATRQVALRGDYDAAKQALHTVSPAGYSHSCMADSDGRLSGSGESPASRGERVRAFSFGALSAEEVEDTLAGISDFRTLASIPLSGLRASEDFKRVEILPSFGDVTSQGEGRYSGGVGDEDVVKLDFRALTHLLPENITVVNGRVVALSGRERAASPFPLRASVAFGGGSVPLASGGWQLSVEVELVRDGGVIRRRAEADDALTWVASPEESFPRWLFYPDRDARFLTLTFRKGMLTRRWRMTLTPHGSLEGAYWFRGLSSGLPEEYTGDIAGEEYTGESAEEGFPDSWPALARVAVSAPQLPVYFPGENRFSCGSGPVTAAVPSVRSLSSGQLGEFPMLVFAEEGVWAVGTITAGGFRAVQPVSLYRSVNPKAVTASPSGTFFMTQSGPMLVNGTQVKGIPSGWPEDTVEEFKVNACAWYDSGRDSLHLFLPGGSEVRVYDFSEGEWNVVGSQAPAYVAGEGMSALAVGVDGSILGGESGSVPRSVDTGVPALGGGLGTLLPGVTLRPDTPPSSGSVTGVLVEERWWLLTLRPLKLGSPHTLKKLRDVEVLEGGGVRMRLWGEASGHWHPLAEATDRLRSLAGSGWRRYRLQLLFRSASQTPGPLLLTLR